MRLMFIADIHGNGNALQRFIRDTNKQTHLNYDELHCLGDLFGYYGEPQKTWELVEKYVLKTGGDLRMGNHDIILGGWDSTHLYAIGDVNDAASMAIALHRGVLEQDLPGTEFQSLIKLLNHDDYQRPYEDNRHEPYHLIYVHGQPHGSQVSDYSLKANYLTAKTESLVELRRALEYGRHRAEIHGKPTIIIYGHTHLPMFAYLQEDGCIDFLGSKYSTPDADYAIDLEELFSREGDRAVKVVAVNGGSIGQPRDGIGEITNGIIYAHGLLLDIDKHCIKFVAVPCSYSSQLYKMQQLRPSVHLIKDDILSVLSRHLQAYYRNILNSLPINTLDQLSFSNMDELNQVISSSIDNPNHEIYKIYDILWQQHIVPKLYFRLFYPDRLTANGSLFYDYTKEGFTRTDRVPF